MQAVCLPDTQTFRPTAVCAISYAGGVWAVARPTSEGAMHGEPRLMVA